MLTKFVNVVFTTSGLDNVDKTQAEMLSFKRSKLPKFSQLVYVVEVIQSYMSYIKIMSGQSV